MSETGYGRRSQQFSLGWLLNPFGRDTFVDTVWAKDVLRVERDDRKYYEGLLPESSLEFVLSLAARIPGAVEILTESDNPGRCRSLEQAVQAFRRGKSLRIDSIQRFVQPVAALSRSLEQEISCPVNVNMYLSPGSGKKALKRHYDTHDVFVVQVHGRKTWRLYDTPMSSPLDFLPLQRGESMKEMKRFRLTNDQSGRDICKLSKEFVLKSGECLYIPRGFWHEAESGDGEVSCHLTVGIQPKSLIDVMTVELGRRAANDARLREPLPFGYANGTDLSATEAKGREVLQSLLDDWNPRDSVAEMSSFFFRTRRGWFEDRLLRRAGEFNDKDIAEDTLLRVRPGAIADVVAGDKPKMIFSNREYEIDPNYVEACRHISTGRPFTPAQLPGQLTLEQKLVLSRQLTAEGLLFRKTRASQAVRKRMPQ